MDQHEKSQKETSLQRVKGCLQNVIFKETDYTAITREGTQMQNCTKIRYALKKLNNKYEE